MRIHTVVVGQLQACCYLVWCESAGQAVIIDPGGDPEKIARAVEREGVEPVLIADTHGHADHIAANGAMKAKYPGARLVVHRFDAAMLEDPGANLSALFGVPIRSPRADRVLDDGEVITFGEESLKVIHIGGHSPGSVCLSGEGRNVLFSGDTLFAGGIGRTDFPGGDHRELIQGIRDKILTLPPETVLYPGHGPASSVGEEARENPFLQSDFEPGFLIA